MITSFSNPLIKRIKRIRQKKYRERENAYFIEGLRVVMSAVEAGAPVEALVYSPELLSSAIAWQMITEQQDAGVRCVELSAAVFGSISDRDNPVGLGAIVGCRWMALDEVIIHPGDVFVALVQVAEPGNLGAVLRSMDATGAAVLILVGPGVDPFHPTAVKASMGALYSVPIVRVDDINRLMEWSISHGLQATATTAKGERLYWMAQYRRPVLLIMGSERQGLSSQIVSMADQVVSIPMAGSASSLNLAVAAGVLLYELARQQQDSQVTGG
jgi:TrmH family RNA methyltransferase